MAKTCSKCGSSNISFTREESVTLGGSKHSIGGGIQLRKGITYWLLFGWWIWIFKAMFKLMISCCTLGLVRIGKSGKKVNGSTISASKTINHTVAICQNCGNTWKV